MSCLGLGLGLGLGFGFGLGPGLDFGLGGRLLCAVVILFFQRLDSIFSSYLLAFVSLSFILFCIYLVIRTGYLFLDLVLSWQALDTRRIEKIDRCITPVLAKNVSVSQSLESCFCLPNCGL